MPAKSPLRQLADIISASVDQIEANFAKSNLEYPSLDAPFNPTLPAEALANSPEAIQAAQLIVSACGQLTAIVKIPALSLLEAVGGYHVSSSIRAVCEGNVVEILREAGPNGLHAKKIAAKNGMEPIRTSRILRLLATHHIFREVSPDVYANNKLSSMMDTLKPFEAVKGNPEDKHDGTPGMTALLEHSSDEAFKGSSTMTETLRDPVAGHSDLPEHAPAAIANKTKSLWDWFEEPENKFRLKRFAAAMEGSTKSEPPDAILQGFDWSQLAAKSIIVDVGGGSGSMSIKIAKKYPHLQVVVQDRPMVIEEAKGYWDREFPTAVNDGVVKLQAHDFFNPQPVKNATIFLLRMITHDYGRANAIKILKQLRDAAAPTTKLLVVDQILPYATLEDPAVATGKDIQGAEQLKPPEPLLANLGRASAIAYLADLHMYVNLNGEERTLGSFLDIFRESGWKVERIYTVPGSLHKQILAVPTRA